MALDKFISKKGYKSDSPDRNNPYNIIPSGRITMQNVPHPVYGIDNLGNEQIMYPGQEYMFPGEQVMEIPVGFHRMPDGTIMSNEEHQQMQTGGQAYNDSLLIHNWGESNYKEFQKKPSMEEWVSALRTTPYSIFEAFDRLEELNKTDYNPSQTVEDNLQFKDGRTGQAGVNRYPKPVGNKRSYVKPLKHIPSKGLNNSYNKPTIDSTKREGIPTPPPKTIIGYTQKWDKENKKWIQEPILQVVPEPLSNYMHGGNIQTNGGYNISELNNLQQGGEYIELMLTEEEIADMRSKGYIVDEL